jgi:flagellar biosynthesis protein FlhG
MLDRGRDQAFGLRRLFGARELRLLPVASEAGDRQAGGFVVNLAAALARAGRHPVVIDAHPLGAASQLGMRPKYELADLLRGERTFASVAQRSAEGFSVLCAHRGLVELGDDGDAADAVFSAIASLRESFDIALVHASGSVLGDLLAHRPTETAVLCGPRDDDLTATYARLKSLVHAHGLSRFRVVFDRASQPAEIVLRHHRLAAVAERYLAAAVEYGGSIAPGDDLRDALRARASVFAVAAQGSTARAFERIANAARHWQLPAFEATVSTIH